MRSIHTAKPHPQLLDRATTEVSNSSTSSVSGLSGMFRRRRRQDPTSIGQTAPSGSRRPSAAAVRSIRARTRPPPSLRPMPSFPPTFRPAAVPHAASDSRQQPTVPGSFSGVRPQANGAAQGPPQSAPIAQCHRHPRGLARVAAIVADNGSGQAGAGHSLIAGTTAPRQARLDGCR